jgi:thiamine pyrophosphate-dependent acetolactate synthase large subunit-like protein
VGGGVSHRVTTHGDLIQALESAFSDQTRMHVLNVILDPADRSAAMMRLAHRLAKRVAARER